MVLELTPGHPPAWPIPSSLSPKDPGWGGMAVWGTASISYLSASEERSAPTPGGKNIGRVLRGPLITPPAEDRRL